MGSCIKISLMSWTFLDVKFGTVNCTWTSRSRGLESSFGIIKWWFRDWDWWFKEFCDFESFKGVDFKLLLGIRKIELRKWMKGISKDVWREMYLWWTIKQTNLSITWGVLVKRAISEKWKYRFWDHGSVWMKRNGKCDQNLWPNFSFRNVRWKCWTLESKQFWNWFLIWISKSRKISCPWVKYSQSWLLFKWLIACFRRCKWNS